MNMILKTANLVVVLAVTCSLLGCQASSDEKLTKKEIQGKTTASEKAKAAGYLYGTVRETMDSSGYTYILLEYEGKKTWVAVPATKVEVGQEVMLYPGQVMKNFHSKGLNRTFETIIFSQGAVSAGAVSPAPTSSANGDQAASKAHSASSKIPKKDVKIEPATGPGAITVEMAYEKASELDGKQVVLKAVVVKVAKNILGKNWVHCQDGTGSVDKHDYDITVTTKSMPSVGEKVLIKGVLHKDRDIGAGYFYPVLIEDAEITAIGKNAKE